MKKRQGNLSGIKYYGKVSRAYIIPPQQYLRIWESIHSFSAIFSKQRTNKLLYEVFSFFAFTVKQKPMRIQTLIGYYRNPFWHEKAPQGNKKLWQTFKGLHSIASKLKVFHNWLKPLPEGHFLLIRVYFHKIFHVVIQYFVGQYVHGILQAKVHTSKCEHCETRFSLIFFME